MPSEPRDLASSTTWHLIGLWGLGVAQPLFDLLGRTPEAFVLRGSRPLDVVLLAVVLLPGLPLLLSLACSGPRRWADAVSRTLVALLGAVLAVQVLGRVTVAPAPVVTAAGLAAGVLLAVWRERSPNARRFLTWIGVLSLVLPLVFLARAPLGALRGLGGETVPASAVRAPRTVVLVVLDELTLTSLLDREGRVDGVLFPRFAELAATSTWYPDATAVAAVTEQALPAILTGTRPRAGGLPTLEDHPRNLFTLLGASHDFHVREPRTQLCPPERRISRHAPLGERLTSLGRDVTVVAAHVISPPGWREHLPDISRSWQGFGKTEESRADESRDIRGFLATLPEVASARPQLVVLHALLPHSPWIFLPSGMRYPPESGPLERRGFQVGRWIDWDWTVIQAQQRHLLQTRYTDRLLGELIDRLRAADLWDDALVVVTADHGISFRPGGLIRDADAGSLADVASVPLFVKRPGQTSGRTDPRPAELVDLLPTIVEELGIDVDWTFEGRSLQGEPPEERRREIYNGPGSTVAFGEADLAGRQVALRRKLALFGSGDVDGLFRIGPFRDVLWGRPAADLEIREPQERAAVELDHAERWTRIAADAAVLPARLTGRWRGTEPAVLALEVNGAVEAITLADPDRDEGAFSAMVREAAWNVGGTNDVAAYRVKPEGGRPILEPLRLAPPLVYTLGEDVRSSDGESWRLLAVPPRGAAWLVRSGGGSPRVELVGWARHPETGALPERFVLFAGGRFVQAGGLGLRRQDLRRRYAAFELDSGGGLAWSLLPGDLEEGAPLRLAALFADGSAAILEPVVIEARDVAPEWG